MSRSVTKGNAFVDDSDAGVLSDDVPARRPSSLHSADRPRSEVYSEGRSDVGKPLDKRRSVSTESGHRRAESFNEKEGYERGYASAPVTGPPRAPVTNYTGSYAPNPSFIRLVRFLLYGLASLSSLATAGVAISVIQWYMSRPDSIKPSWGSCIALIVFGIITPGALFIPFLITPRLFRYGTVLGIVNQVRIELLLLFGLAVFWVSGALAMANDLLGYENCIWDGYYHVPEPSNFHHVCDLINATVIMGYITFGLITLAWFFVTATAIYILLYLDQEVLSELTNDMGGRAYRARTFARQELPPPTQAQRSAYSYNPNGPGMHRRASSIGSRRALDAEDGDIGFDDHYDTEMASSRQIPNPDAAVPMSEKQAMAQRYAREQPGTSAHGGDSVRGGPMMAPTAQEGYAHDRL